MNRSNSALFGLVAVTLAIVAFASYSVSSVGVALLDTGDHVSHSTVTHGNAPALPCFAAIPQANCATTANQPTPESATHDPVKVVPAAKERYARRKQEKAWNPIVTGDEELLHSEYGIVISAGKSVMQVSVERRVGKELIVLAPHSFLKAKDGYNPAKGQEFSYAWQDINVGDHIEVYVLREFDGTLCAFCLRIAYRPGEKVPPTRIRTLNRLLPYHEIQNAMIDWCENGVEIPEHLVKIQMDDALEHLEPFRMPKLPPHIDPKKFEEDWHKDRAELLRSNYESYKRPKNVKRGHY